MASCQHGLDCFRSQPPSFFLRLTDLFHFLRQIFFPHRPRREESDESDQEPSRLELVLEAAGKKLRSRESVGTFVSLLLHGLALLLLSWLMLPTLQEWGGLHLTSDPVLEDIVQEMQSVQNEPDTIVEMPAQETEAALEKPNDEMAVVASPEPIRTEEENKNVVAPVEMETQTLPTLAATSVKAADFVSGGGFEGRTPEGRGKAVGDGDCSSAGEDAVEKGLVWLAAHQMKDGGWSFDFDRTCKQCSHGGTHGSRAAATALALLPFLGAGYTHETGPYQRNIDNGLQYLIRSAAKGQRGMDFTQGGDKSMYAHGIAAMALCEAYAMSKRKRKDLQQVAQESLRFIEEAQDRRGGGWRYRPNESPGDLSVTTWQLMALKSGRLGGLRVSQPVLYNAALFLDSVEFDGGRQYKYVPTDGRQGTGPESAINCSATGLRTVRK